MSCTQALRLENMVIKYLDYTPSISRVFENKRQTAANTREMG